MVRSFSLADSPLLLWYFLAVAAPDYLARHGRPRRLDRQYPLVRYTHDLGEHGAQALVPRHQIAERKLQCSDIEIARQAHRQRNRVGCARTFEAIEKPQPPLRERQRHLGGTRKRPQRLARPTAIP